jgi:DNA-binding response OmpR family regulator
VEFSARRAAIALALVGADAAAAERDRNRQGSDRQPTLGAASGAGVEAQAKQTRAMHQRVIAKIPARGRNLNAVNHLLFFARMLYCGRRRARDGPVTRNPMSNVRKILIVDDDSELRDALVEQLSLHEEFEAVAADSGAKGVQAARAGQIDLVIMDVGLPDIDGREAVRILRKNGFKAPIIMLTGHDTDSDTILGLESGANDYVVKPFRFAVLLARIRAQLRQHEASEDAVFNIGPYTFRPSSKLLISPKGNKVRLTEKETAILRYLYRAGQRPVSREVLLQEVWGYNSGVTTHTLETHIYRLRQKVEKDAAIPAILVTEAGGYKLVP